MAAHNEQWMLDRVVLPGDTSINSPWSDLGDVMGPTFNLKTSANFR